MIRLGKGWHASLGPPGASWAFGVSLTRNPWDSAFTLRLSLGRREIQIYRLTPKWYWQRR